MTKLYRRNGATPSWLPQLMRIYAAIDHSVAVATARRTARTGRKPVCGADCPHCCRQPVPASIPELAGAVWRLRTVCDAPSRAAVLKAMRAPDINRCPFLLGCRCAIYPLRFMACREFVMFGPVCGPDEDPWSTRPDDLLRPETGNKLLAFTLLASLLGLSAGLDRQSLFQGVMRASPPVQLWNLTQPDYFVQLMDAGPPFPSLPSLPPAG